ncbi:MAG TPA: hypothetical protein VH619_06840 [Verrucomicrobiae bacterium]|jgi:hypothetical protein|nr:hypothetical protein [Verrucomicrobiae bacterium]
MKYIPLKHVIPAAALLVAPVIATQATPAPTPDVPAYRPFSIGLDASTLGPGASFGWRFMDHLGATLGADYVSVSANTTIKDVNYDARLQFLYESLTVDVFPWTHSSFHASAGLVLNQFELGGSANGPLTLNGNHYMGNIDLAIRQQAADPYIGIGGNLLYFDHAHHWALTGNLGAMYTGSPRVSLSGTESGPPSPTFQSDLEKVRGEIKHDARYAEIWPAVALGISYSF